VLVLSPLPLNQAVYLVGRYQANRFTPEVHGTVDGSANFYAPQSFVDQQGRRIMDGWMAARGAQRNGSTERRMVRGNVIAAPDHSPR
jgi:beta-fructofuranosidase